MHYLTYYCKPNQNMNLEYFGDVAEKIGRIFGAFI